MRFGDAYMAKQSGSSLIQIMTCPLFGVRPLPESGMTYCQLDPQEQIKFSEILFLFFLLFFFQ